VASFALKFGPPEFLRGVLAQLLRLRGDERGKRRKTVASMMIGFRAGRGRLDSVTGTLRLTFGFTSLLKGFDFLIAVIGLFGIGEILETLERGLAFKGASAKINAKVVLETWKELPKYWATSLRKLRGGGASWGSCPAVQRPHPS